jgi:hypothetical protein
MRFYRITFVGGLAIGYVLGAQAGRERYEQLKRLARKAAESPAMQQTAGALQAQAAATARVAKEQAATTARSARHQAAATAKSAKDRAASGIRKSSAKVPRRRSEHGQDASRTADVSANGAMPPGDSDDHRPFVPVDGSFLSEP